MPTTPNFTRAVVFMTVRLVGLLVSVGPLLTVTPATAQTPANVLVIVNDRSAASLEIGRYYANRRGVPPEQLLRIDSAPVDQISRPAYRREIELPIERWLTTNRAHDRILYIVLTKGVPLTIEGTMGRRGTLASVDSELALLYRRMTGLTVPSGGRVPNPYFAGASSPADPNDRQDTVATTPHGSFSHEEHDIYLVTRLDGFTVEDVKGLVDRGFAPNSTGRIVLDQRAALDSPADDWLALAAANVDSLPYQDVLIERTTRAITNEPDVLGYYSWGSGDPALASRRLGFGYVAGAIAGSFVGTNARTFSKPPADWTIGSWRDRMSYYKGTPEGLAADLVREGVTGVSGHVADPYLDGTVRPDILFPAYLRGHTLAEAFYMATPDLSWRTIIIGDPLCAPFRTTELTDAQKDPGFDDATTLPRYFSARRIDTMVAEGNSRDIARLLVQAEWQLATSDRVGARRVLEEAATLDEVPAATHLTLGTLYQEAGDDDLAIEQYRLALSESRNNVIVLNNLAYLLAQRPETLEEAYRLSQRAYTLAGNTPEILDTFGWIHHLRGDDREAQRHLSRAAQGRPESSEIRLHAAIVFAAVGQLNAAARELAEALELDPSLAGTPDVAALQHELRLSADGRER